VLWAIAIAVYDVRLKKLWNYVATRLLTVAVTPAVQTAVATPVVLPVLLPAVLHATPVLQPAMLHATHVHQHLQHQLLLLLSQHQLAKQYQLLHHQKSLRLTSHHDCRKLLSKQRRAAWLGCLVWLAKLDLIAGLITIR
jgi:hypothetical protein